MAVSILIATPSQAFGELIRETLLEADEYQPVLATNLNGLVQHAQHERFDLLILDLDMAGVALFELWQAIQKSTPEIRLAAISWQGAEDSTILNSIKPDGLLTKPFYAPDLVKAIQSILSSNRQSPRVETIVLQDEFVLASKDMNKIPTGKVEQPDETPDGTELKTTKGMDVSWLEDVTRAAQHLTRLSLEADALAALITRSEQLWSYAGQLPQPAAEELAQIVLRDWSDRLQTGISDLVCFVHLQSTGEEYMLYATRLDEEMALALAFDAQTPFSRIRAQANHLARALAEPPNGIVPELSATTSSSRFSQEPNSLDAIFEEKVEEEELGAEFPVEPLFPLEIVPPPTPDQSEFDQHSSKSVNRSSEEEKPDENLARENIPNPHRPLRTILQSALDLAAEHLATPGEMNSDMHGIFQPAICLHLNSSAASPSSDRQAGQSFKSVDAPAQPRFRLAPGVSGNSSRIPELG